MTGVQTCALPIFIIARTGRAPAATALVEKHDAVSLRIEKPGGRAVAACARTAMHDDDGLAGERAVLLPIDPMLGKSWRRQMAGPDERRVRRLVVRRGRRGACIHGTYFCDKWEACCEQERALARQLTPTSRASSFCRSTRRAPGILS